MAPSALDRLISVKNLQEIWRKYKPRAKGSAPGIDGVTPEQFGFDIAQQIKSVQEQVRKGYTFSALRGVAVPKKDPSKFRVICVPTVQDRVIQRALLAAIEGKARQLRIVNDVSFGFVKDTVGTKRGATAARSAAVRHRQFKPWAFKADIAAFFDRIDRESLISGFEKSFQLRSLSPLVKLAIGCEVDERDMRVRRILSENGIKRGHGLRQGMPLSPILSNFLLRDFDRAFVAARLDLVRYADDLIVFASTREECAVAEALARAELSKLGLGLSEQKTETCAPNDSVEFLGMELGLRAGTSTYGLAISDRQLARIHEQFTQYHDVDFAAAEGLDLLSLLRRLDNMKSGYQTAYHAADNRRYLNQQLEQWTKNCTAKVYQSIFGSQAVAKLTPRQRQFLLLSQKNKFGRNGPRFFGAQWSIRR